MNEPQATEAEVLESLRLNSISTLCTMEPRDAARVLVVLERLRADLNAAVEAEGQIRALALGENQKLREALGVVGQATVDVVALAISRCSAGLTLLGLARDTAGWCECFVGGMCKDRRAAAVAVGGEVVRVEEHQPAPNGYWRCLHCGGATKDAADVCVICSYPR